jgi:pimeloyl-ACP methyl ester carboxylesterase
MQQRERFIEHDGVRLRVRESGEGETLILIHGWALDLDMWSPQFAALSQNYRLVAFDRRGFGLSSGTPSTEHDLADLRALIAQMQLARASLLGMSQGARAAIGFAQAHSKLVRCLVLDGPPRIGHMNEPRSNEIPLSRYRELVRKNGLRAFRREWEQHALMQLHTDDAELRRLLRAIVERYPGRDLQPDHVEPKSAAIDWHGLAVPTLVLNGEWDSAERLAAGQEIAHLMPDAHRVLVPKAGHLSNLDNPLFYNDAIDAFLRSAGTQQIKNAY